MGQRQSTPPIIAAMTAIPLTRTTRIAGKTWRASSRFMMRHGLAQQVWHWDSIKCFCRSAGCPQAGLTIRRLGHWLLDIIPTLRPFLGIRSGIVRSLGQRDSIITSAIRTKRASSTLRFAARAHCWTTRIAILLLIMEVETVVSISQQFLGIVSALPFVCWKKSLALI